jgi:hypothetical protein
MELCWLEKHCFSAVCLCTKLQVAGRGGKGEGGGLFLVVLEVMYELPAALLEVVPHLVDERPRDHHVHQHARQQRDKHHLGPGVIVKDKYRGHKKIFTSTVIFKKASSSVLDLKSQMETESRINLFPFSFYSVLR